MYKKILVPTDASEFSKRALEEAIKIAKITEGEIILVHVVHTPASYWGYALSYGITVNEESLENVGKVALDITLADIDVDVPLNKKIVSGNTVVEIIKEIDKQKIDLVVMGSHGHGFVTGSILGSVSQKILHETKCPVLIVK
ncbi:universal stress protein [Alkalibaculum sp. M08DMB]|uniref:Universal stress protein n=1 Tax=Alkalibaculum sporogenes TaxID=2655001 RepID=A0A6A7KCY0_9FIRM|nr:universal stress protein [Alkalibaculum sporogenes]MPW27202.1 universal stress protein [Alkalibaculum sporogenes]